MALSPGPKSRALRPGAVYSAALLAERSQSLGMGRKVTSKFTVCRVGSRGLGAPMLWLLFSLRSCMSGSCESERERWCGEGAAALGPGDLVFT